MGGRYGGAIRGSRRQSRVREPWPKTWPTPKPKAVQPRRAVDPRWVALGFLAGYSVLLGMLPILL